MSASELPEILVLCLCADWCGTCRSYRATFETVAREHPQAAFHWVDVEDDAKWFGDIEVETFPTLLIQRGDVVGFLGPVLPQPQHLQRTLATILTMEEDALRSYASAHPDRRAWQEVGDMREALRRRAEEAAR